MIKTEEEVDKLIEGMRRRTKGKYITQGVSFNKDCPRQMRLLKDALLSSASFSGLVKETLAVKFENNVIQPVYHPPKPEKKHKDISGFI